MAMPAPVPKLAQPIPVPVSGLEAGALLPRGVDRLFHLQDRQHGHDRWAVLLVHRALGAAGQDGTLQHIMYGVPARRCQVVSFKAPSAEELDHDFLWRSLRALPPHCRTGFITRSSYEDVLLVKMCPKLLAAAKVPGSLVGKHVWDERYEDIRDVEHHLARSGTAIRKFCRQVSTGEQRRFLKRLNAPDRLWPLDLADLRTRDRWGDYMRAYEGAIHDMAADADPGAGLPIDEKWFTRLVVAAVIVQSLQSLGERYSTEAGDTLARRRQA
jgi:polyphosphate kinase 2 (PPK2 family)